MSRRKSVINTDKLILTLQDENKQKKVRDKHRQTDIDTARCNRAEEQKKVRDKHRQTDIETARRSQAEESP
ncbi:hypothetical protein DPMN_064303 [Dreissena polymorpha]|uniref:Uncharacterized protein n=1 Tax=Dreissena polymorpha TaxID=45954 RepID=A0A9D4CD76_DREPO|nr:hypothetical protein DPMN_064303 [Dreissena polymorpha]